MLSQFLNFNRQCPCCGDPLTLYMRWADSITFKATLEEPNIYRFDPIITPEKLKEFESAFMYIVDEGENVVTDFSSNSFMQESKKQQLYFFFLCNPAGIKHKKDDWEIHLYKGCYYRSSPFFEFKKEGDDWQFKLTDPMHQNFTNKDQAFAFKVQESELEKIYMVNMDSESDCTYLWYYTVTEAEKKTKGFKPKVFDKKLPALPVMPKLGINDRWKLIERLDSWIIMS